MDHPPSPPPEYEFLDTTLDQLGADAFVHIADRFDDDLRYLTRFSGPDRPYGFVYCDSDAILLTPSLFHEQGVREFPGDTVISREDWKSATAAGGAVELLDVRAVGDRIAVPPQLRHDAQATLSQAGYEAVTTSAVRDRRERKSSAEKECLASVETAAQRGMRRAEAVLVEADVNGNALIWNGESLTTEVLRREINAELARQGVRDAGYSVIGAGPSCADLHFTGTDAIRPGESVLIDLSPRGPHGYYGDFTRTFVVGEPDEWIKTAYEAVKRAQDAALAVLEGGAGTRAADVHETAAQELAADGFEAGDVDVGFYHGVGHGIGVRLHEGPSLTDDRELATGNAVTVEPGVYDPEVGGVRIEDLAVVTEDGYENLADYPCSITPSRSLESRS